MGAKIKSYHNTKGVSKRKNGMWEAYLNVKQSGKRSAAKLKIYIGVFPSEIEAQVARVKFIKNLL